LERLDDVDGLARRRGFYWPSFEIYGGVGGLYDVGQIGLRVKHKLEGIWRRFFLEGLSLPMVEVETPLITPSRVLEASGHVSSFTDPLVECPSCHRVYRADQLLEAKLGVNAEGLGIEELNALFQKNDVRCDACGARLGGVKTFNLLFKTNLGPFTSDVAYVRPETAQGMFTSFKRIFEASRRQLPLGVAQVGRVARNEISPRQSLIRMREFTIMEFEFFFDPADLQAAMSALGDMAAESLNLTLADGRELTLTPMKAVSTSHVKTPWMAYFMEAALQFLLNLGFKSEEVRFVEKGDKERAHYSAQTFDVMIPTKRWGLVEVAGISYRTDYDLRNHSIKSGQDLSVSVTLEKPFLQASRRVVAHADAVRVDFGEHSGEVLAAISTLDPSQVGQEVELNLSFGRVRLGPRHFAVQVEERLVSAKKLIPHVVEPSFGSERLLYALLDRSLVIKEGRVVLALPSSVAPYDCSIFPLVKRDDMGSMAKRLESELREAGYSVFYDEDGSIGKRYARSDEIGIPVAITIDQRSLEDNSVTVRDRDSWKQWRARSSELAEILRRVLSGKSLISLGLEEFSRRPPKGKKAGG